MKKTLAALIVSAVAASAANAAVIYDNEGSKVELNGSLRLIMEKTSEKKGSNKSETDSALRNAGSRLGVTVKHNLDGEYYALGRYEARFDDTSSNDRFGGVYTKRAFVGLGSKAHGDLTFGRQLTIADDLSQTVDYEYGINPKDKYVLTSGHSVVRYDYKGIEGVQLSANYNFKQHYSDKGMVLKQGIKNAFALGALFTAGDLDARFAYGHTNYETGTKDAHRLDGVLASFGYTMGDFKVIADLGYGHKKVADAKTNKFYVSPGFAYQVSPASKVYGNYLYQRAKGESDKAKTHGFLLGADYKLHKQVVVFLEGKYERIKEFEQNARGGYTETGKKTEKAIGVGMRVFF